MLKLNPHISVDCVVFGFDKAELKVLVLNPVGLSRQKLPGSLIAINEDLHTSANRTLEELTGLKNIYLEQFNVFDSPDRIKNKEDIHWLRQTTGLSVERIVSVAYFSLIKIKEINNLSKEAKWISLSSIQKMAFDHAHIIHSGLRALRYKLATDAVAFELLPQKFTLNQLHLLYEIILGVKLDNRNFRKKIKKLHYIVETEDREKNVAHKPARYYQFNKRAYLKQKKEQLIFTI